MTTDTIQNKQIKLTKALIAHNARGFELTREQKFLDGENSIFDMLERCEPYEKDINIPQANDNHMDVINNHKNWHQYCKTFYTDSLKHVFKHVSKFIEDKRDTLKRFMTP